MGLINIPNTTIITHHEAKLADTVLLGSSNSPGAQSVGSFVVKFRQQD